MDDECLCRRGLQCELMGMKQAEHANSDVLSMDDVSYQQHAYEQLEFEKHANFQLCKLKALTQKGAEIAKKPLLLF
jgi:hypothetical protein